jgi:rhodanese-related sulfurtransferase
MATTCKILAQGRSAAQAPKVHTSHAKKPAAKALPKLTAALLANGGLARLAAADDDLALPSLPELALPEFSLPAIPADASSFLAENGLIIGGAAFIILLPLGIQAILGAADGGGGPKPTNALKALEALAEDERVVLLDVRSRAEVAAQGKPDLRSAGKGRNAVPLAFTVVKKGEVSVVEGFAEKYEALKGLDEESLVIVLDG